MDREHHWGGRETPKILEIVKLIFAVASQNLVKISFFTFCPPPRGGGFAARLSSVFSPAKSYSHNFSKINKNSMTGTKSIKIDKKFLIDNR